ncbi:MAG: type II CAAX endopeptidase family protein [Candidatus Acidiferrales bacterium]
MTNDSGGFPVEPIDVDGDRPRPVAPVWHTIVLLIFIIGISALQRPQVLTQETIQISRIWTYLLTLAYELLLLGYVWFLGLTLHGVALREIIGGKWQHGRDFLIDVAIALLFWVAVVGLLTFAHFVLGFSGVDAAKSMYPKTLPELGVFVVLAVFAGFCEEIIFRGYLQRQFTAWTGKVSAGVVLQALVFGAGHIYQGWKGVVVISVYGAMFGVLAALRKSLRPGMMQHCAQDGFSGIAVWAAQKYHLLPMILR